MLLSKLLNDLQMSPPITDYLSFLIAITEGKEKKSQLQSKSLSYLTDSERVWASLNEYRNIHKSD